MNKRSVVIVLVLAVAAVVSAWIIFVSHTPADTIYTNDGKEIRGIVVEEYNDRLVLSTADGEVTVMKSDIRELTFDSEEDNLVRLAQQAMDRHDQSRAYSCYERALKINPDSKAAKDGLVYLQSYILRQQEAKKENDIRRQESLERSGGAVTEGSAEEDMAATLERTAGMAIAIKDNFPQVVSVKSGSPAHEAGIRKGDILSAIWGKLTGYMSLDDIIYTLLKRSALEIRCTIERSVEVPIDPGRQMMSGPEGIIGAGLSMEIDGLTVSTAKDAAAGLERGDLVVAINGKPTRYMRLKAAVDFIRNVKADAVTLTLRRNLIIWRRSEI